MNYEKVPSMLSGKDLDYLSDMFNWNFGAYKSAMNNKEKVTDPEMIAFIEKTSNIFHENLTMILNILKQGGSYE